MKLIKETILGSAISELVSIMNVSMNDFLSEYENLFAKYIDFSALSTLMTTSEPAENWNIIQKAKTLALGRICKEKNNRTHSLCSIFSNLSINDSYPIKRYYEPKILTEENIMPCPQIKDFAINRILQNFCDELTLCMRTPPKEFNSFLIVLDTLLKKYFWSIPASNEEFEDISLYEYIRTTTAIVAVLLREGEKDTPYVLAAGHFSGIQKYIFSVSKVGTGGVAKRLRARSFYVNAMVSALAHCIIHKIELPMMNILMLTGGKFYILLPNTQDTINELQKIEQQVTRYLYEKFKGNLSLELVWEKVTDEGLRSYNDTVRILSKHIEKKKCRLLENVLTDGKEWNTEHFVVYQDLNHKSMCKACKSALVDDGKEMCLNCETDTAIGGILPKIKTYSFSRKKGQYQLLDDYFLNLDRTSGTEETYLIMLSNDCNITEMYDKPVTINYAVNHVPLQQTTGEIKTFSEIAENAKGCKKLGILKADVDTLGFLFSQGLQSTENEKIPISRINTLSFMLDLFFGKCLNQLIENRYQNIYCVFSGGDDLFLIGPWSDIPALAIDINKEFHEYTGDNPYITLSAAICMAESGGHISTLAEQCEEKLNQVKQRSDYLISPGKEGRNGIYFLGKTMSWEDFQEQIARGKEYAQATVKIGVGFFRRLASYSNMYQDYHRNKDVDKLIFLPLFANDRMRNNDTLKKLPDFQKHCAELYKSASNYNRINKQFYYVEFCVKYALWLTKEERRNGSILG